MRLLLLVILSVGMAASTSLGSQLIEAMEAGASDLARQGQIPSKALVEHRDRLSELGFGLPDEPSPGLMTDVTFPCGWTTTTEPDDPRHIYLLDAEGKKRIYIFVKRTPYDNYARLSFEP